MYTRIECNNTISEVIVVEQQFTNSLRPVPFIFLYVPSMQTRLRGEVREEKLKKKNRHHSRKGN